MSPPVKDLVIKNAKENNLKGVSLSIPHDTLTILTGVSGSGKSSLAFDTVYAEGQRRYIETFSPYTRQFFDKVKKPDVEQIQNVRPAIAIQQRTRILNSRSTVGSMTGVNDYLKVLWSNIAQPYCPDCGVRLIRWDAASLAPHLRRFAELRTRNWLLICSSVRIESEKELTAESERLTTLGYSRYFNPKTQSVERLEETQSPILWRDNQLLLVLDRVKGENTPEKRLRDSIEQAFALSQGSCVIVEQADAASEKPSVLEVLNTQELRKNSGQKFEYHEFLNYYSCGQKSLRIERARPSLFSYNHPLGACPECKGFGRILSIDQKLCVPDSRLSIEDKALQCWSSERARGEFRRLLKFCKQEGISTTTPWKELPQEQREEIFTHKSRDFKGIFDWFKRLERKAYKMHVRVFLARYRSQVICPLCHGTRLKPSALAWRVEGVTLPEIWERPVDKLLYWFEDIKAQVQMQGIFSRALGDTFNAVISRLRFLNNLGLSYLDLNRQARTLSGGETQRVNLAAALGSELISTHFVLDEPSVGLHARDTRRLIDAIRGLQQQGNSLLVVEHDLDCIAEADYVIELGPQAGDRGGEIVYSGWSADWLGVQESRTSTEAAIAAVPEGKISKPLALSVSKANARNLKNISFEIPLGKFVCLTGVSGSGKSSLVAEVLKSGWERKERGEADSVDGSNQVLGFEHIDQLLLIDQSPLAKSPRGNIATYSGIWDTIRERLAGTDEAITRALSKSAFSFNVDGGRCPACKGAGFIREDMQFLSDVYIPCEVCLGKRFQQAVLEVTYRGLSAHDFLQMSVERCAEFFTKENSIRQTAETLCLLGLGHLALGNPLSELSGGEAQRLKLVPFIEKSERARSLLVFDEPTTGLHLRDVHQLVYLLKVLRSKGHSILCVEHNLELISACDWIIDLGPEGGDKGGELVLTGTPRDFQTEKAQKHSYTATFLTEYIQTQGKPRARGKGTHSAPRPTQGSNLVIRGAREHNLKNLDIEIPLDQVVALTGVSGSGKSSIAKDIIYAEGQRRYLDCLSPYARQFIKELKKPEIDSLQNIKPTICVYQHTFQPSRLSTVATMSEVYNFMRLLYAKTGIQHCPEHPKERIAPLSPREIAQQIKRQKVKQLRILAPVIKLKKGNHRAVLERAVASEITQIRVDGVFLSPGTVSMSGGLEKTKPHTIEFVLSRFNPANLDLQMIEDAVQQALSIGGGTLIIHSEEGESVFSTERTCPVCKQGFFRPDPEDLSFNSKRGACEECAGTGKDSKGSVCEVCNGSRINALGRNLRLSDLNISEACAMNAQALEEFLKSLSFASNQEKIAESVMVELYSRLRALLEMGLGYIELSRDCSSLSGGELQRLRLSAAFGSPLSGVLYILDEPSAGLHPIDNLHVLGRLNDLKESGNSVIMIEHDSQSILATDYVIDVGPSGGKGGGNIVFSGPIKEFIASPDSITAQCIRQEQQSKVPLKLVPSSGPILKISNASQNTIHELDLEIPLQKLVTVAGISGAGKSSLVHGIIVETIMNGKGGPQRWKLGAQEIKSDVEIERVLMVDQKPIGINSRSTPASYLGMWDEIRKLFASTLEARSRGWKESFFSWNTGKGRCATCKGQGQITLEMSFLPDASIECEVCGGLRFTEDALSVRYLDLNVSQVLNLTFDEARTVFANHRKIHQVLHRACDLGIGYLTLGQSSSTLSGGESQRIKLVSELSASRQGHTLYVLDEPTTGLHKSDVARLMNTLKELISRGHSVFVIEHDSDVILDSEHVIEMGPGPGLAGGKVIFSGPPLGLFKAKTPWGEVLREKNLSFEKLKPGKSAAPKRLAQERR